MAESVQQQKDAATKRANQARRLRNLALDAGHLLEYDAAEKALDDALDDLAVLMRLPQ